MQKYNSYGLVFASELGLPELTGAPDSAAPDVTVRLDPPSGDQAHDWDARPEVEARDEAVTLTWRGVGSFEVREGRLIRIRPARGMSPDVLRLPLLGSVLAVLLHQRGLLVLHASAVAIDGQGVVFLGANGAGKSTLAAALSRGGAELLCDDLVALEVPSVGAPSLLPGFSQLKLWPDAAAAALQQDPEELPLVVPGGEKRLRSTPDRNATAGRLLGAVYLLSKGAAPRVEPVAPQAALAQLIAHSYASRFGSALLQGEAAARHLRQCARTIDTVPVRRLTRTASLEELPELVRLVTGSTGAQGGVDARAA